MTWDIFMRDVRPHVSPLLGPYLDALQDEWATPPCPGWTANADLWRSARVVAVLEFPAALP